jgi:hypothetical protein
MLVSCNGGGDDLLCRERLSCQGRSGSECGQTTDSMERGCVPVPGAVPELIIKTAAALIQTQRIHPRIHVLHTCDFARCGRRTDEHARHGKRLQRRQVELWSRGGKTGEIEAE